MKRYCLSQDGIPVGTWNKYHSKNPAQKVLLWNFFKTIRDIIRPIVSHVKSATDVGCGEGNTSNLLFQSGVKNVKGCDISEMVLKEARLTYPDPYFYKCNIYSLQPKDKSDLVSAFEVIEHLEDPSAGLRNLSAITKKYCLISVPNEPIFRILNFISGKYIKEYGNAPGHLNHWSSTSFVAFVRKYFDVLDVRKPIPWTVVLARPKVT